MMSNPNPRTEEAQRLEAARHSLAHLLAMAVLKKFPSAKLGIGPTIENGFYYDFKLPKAISEEDLRGLEATMRALVGEKLDFEGEKVTAAEAKRRFKDQPFKLDLIKEYAKEGRELTVYRSGNFTDLCKGGHITNTAAINPDAFKLTKIAGAYWRGDEKKPQLTRIYGVAFTTKKELDEHLAALAEAEKRDHRRLGEELGIFMLSEKVGAGFPLWLPNGEIVKHELQEYLRRKEVAAGYRYVSTGALASGALYEASGHKKYFKDDMYRLLDIEGKELFVKPMNCPHHHVMYQKLVQSYRDLPLRLAEPGGIYRNERSGTLHGLMRVRGPITQNDAHIYVARNDLEKEFAGVLGLLKEIYRELELKNYWFRLSLPDFAGKNKAKFGGDKPLWEWAADVIREAAKRSGIEVVEAPGEAAFYGPKLDIQMQNVLGKEDTIATIQVDVLVPKRMGLIYINKEGKEEHPIVIHRAIVGSYERFIAFLLEQTAGRLPFWLAPVQVAVLTVSDKATRYAEEVFRNLAARGVRTALEASADTIGKKIRASELQKIPYLLIVGEREAQSKTVAVRERGKGDLGNATLAEFLS